MLALPQVESAVRDALNPPSVNLEMSMGGEAANEGAFEENGVEA